MKYIRHNLVFVLLFLLESMFSQTNDTFDDLLQWQGDVVNFESLNGELHLNAPSVSGASYLSTPSSISVNSTWQFWSKLNFAPSSTNKLEVVLMSDAPNLNANYNGYFLSIGETGNADAIELYQKTGNTNVKLARGTEGKFANQLDSFLVKVTRSKMFEWQVWVDVGKGFQQEFVVQDSTHLISSYFGFRPIFTSTRNTAFYFDDLKIVGQSFIDSIAPKVIRDQLMTKNSIKIDFDEKINIGTLDINKVTVNGAVAQKAICQDKTCVFVFDDFVVDANLDFLLKGVQDSFGNSIKPFSQQYVYHINTKWDVIISEFLPDPSESVGLPEAEYIEIYNKTSVAINLKNWTISDATTTATLPNVFIAPNNYLLLTQNENIGLFSQNKNNVGLDKMPSLNNSGDQLWLRDSTGVEIFSIHYTLASYRNTQKDDGGYALQVQDFDKLCLGELLLKASSDPLGGSPGKESIVYDSFSPPLPKVFLERCTDSTIVLAFSANVLGADNSINYQIKENTVKQFLWDKSQSKAYISLKTNFQKNESHQIAFLNMNDCLGNPLDTIIQILLTNAPKENELIVTELLFNPPATGSDYLEFYVNTINPILTDSLYLLRLDPITNEELERKPFPKGIFLSPKKYYVCTEDDVFVKQNFLGVEQKQLIKMDIPTLNDDEGKIAISFASKVLDKVYYSSKFHAPFIVEYEAKSLEKIDIWDSGMSATNWFTASEKSGFGTPTQQNTAFVGSFTASNFELSSDRISPDGDGVEDFSLLAFSNVPIGTLLSLKILNRVGLLVAEPYQNYSVSGSGTLLIDGTRNETLVLNAGIYVLLLEIIDIKGNTSVKKMSLTVNLRF